jgi:acyl dehydratase
MIIQTADIRYSVDGRQVAAARANTFRIPRRGSAQGLQYTPRDEYQYSAEEVSAIQHDVAAEMRQGSTHLAFQQLRIGARVSPVVKGPIDRITMTAYYAGCIGSPGYKACEIAWKYRQWAATEPDRLPSNYDPSYFAEAVLPSIGHQDQDVAREIGMPNAYDNGPQRCGWFAHAVTNWMGDRGFLERLWVRLRRPDIFGDTVWVGGEITRLDTQEFNGVVEIRLSAVNQLNELVAEGGARVLIPLDPEAPPAEPAP